MKSQKKTFTHRELCYKAARYLKNKSLLPFHKCQYVFCELERYGECPDALGFASGSGTQLIEVKTSRSDFLSDKNKRWRKKPEIGLGSYRSYLCPEGLIKENELPQNWGLLWVNENGDITEVVKAIKQPCNHNAELHLLTNIMRREGVKPKIYSYKEYLNYKEIKNNINDDFL